MPIQYNGTTKQFERDGSPVDQAVVLALIDKLTATAKRDAKKLSAKLEAGEIGIDEWESGILELLVSAHLVAVSVGRGGQLTTADAERVRNKIEWQRGYLSKWKRSIQTGGVAITAGVIVSRVVKYFSAPFISYEASRRDEFTGQGANKDILCRLITNSKEGCSECAADEAAGWMPVSEMGEIGTRICGDYCLCDIEYEGV